MRRVKSSVVARAWWLTSVALLCALLGFASVAAAKPVALDGNSAGGAQVRVYNRTVAVFRATFLGAAPAERAVRAERRIADLLDRSGPGKVTVSHEALGEVFYLDGSLALALVPGDADATAGQTLEQAAAASRFALERVVLETREARDQNRLLRAAARSGAATLAFLLAVFFALRARHWLVRRLTRWLQDPSHHVRVAGQELLPRERLFGLAQWLVRLVTWSFLLVVTYEWAGFVLKQFPYTRAWGEELEGHLIALAGVVFEGVISALPGLALVLVIGVLARFVMGLARTFFDGLERRGGGQFFDAGMARATRRIFNLAIWLFAAVMAYPYLPGSDSEAFKGMSVLVGLVVTVGASNLFGQAASGLILMYARIVRVGESVRIGEDEGTVAELGTFTTRLKTGRGDELVLPNTVVLGTLTRNYSRSSHGSYLLTTSVSIGYDTPFRQVEALLRQAAARTEGVLATPTPRVFKTELKDFYVVYRLFCDATQNGAEDRAAALDALHGHVLDAFNEAGVQMMSPHYFADPKSPKIVPKDAWHAAPAAKPTAASGDGA